MEQLTLFVTGIGTNVGKSVTSAILCEALAADYWKPVQCGDPNDTDVVKSLVSNSHTTYFPSTYFLKAPKSPHAAAIDEGVTIDPEKFVLPETNRSLVIEGAGGVLVPLTEAFYNIDLILKFNPLVVIVSEHYVGSINHTLLTFEALKKRKVSILGFVFNGEENRQSEEVIKGYSELPMIARVQKEPVLTPQIIQEYGKKVAHALSFVLRRKLV